MWGGHGGHGECIGDSMITEPPPHRRDVRTRKVPIIRRRVSSGHLSELHAVGMAVVRES